MFIISFFIVWIFPRCWDRVTIVPDVMIGMSCLCGFERERERERVCVCVSDL